MSYMNDGATLIYNSQWRIL